MCKVQYNDEATDSPSTVLSPAKHVALFGFYNRGNFGDDLMAVIIGTALQEHRIEFKVYGLPSKVREEFGFAGEDTISRLLENASVVVIGGGGFLLSQGSRLFDDEIKRLCDECEVRSIPIYMISVGGDGKPYDQLSPARQRVLDQAEFVTFRNQEDRLCLQGAASNKQVYVFSDIVWSTGAVLPFSRNPKGKGITIGVDASISEKRARVALRLLRMLERASLGRVQLVMVRQNWNDQRAGSYDDDISYGDGFEEFVRRVAALDIIVTQRLHVGLLGMSYGNSVFYVFPQAKTKLLMRRVGLSRCSIEHTWQYPKLLLLGCRKCFLRLCAPPARPNRQEMLWSSGQHVSMLLKRLDGTMRP
ncbi:MAG: polysaccharide pyruvyl transferase family protein [Spiribacter salinus]|uniref:Polysaccharide pyruvyl transferase family protein n=1 Tax=Spiribacter salinus TaxID=1335746 RepID=A0A540VTQ3_9GAMM|nr:MAG: polysaccharide pyruvyl transferase family protein [Spiribacter salinus]